MTRFYTCVRKWGDTILHREVDSGRRVTAGHDYKPVMFMTDASGKETRWRAMDTGQPISVFTCDSVKELADTVKRYEGTGVLYGQNNAELNFIAHTYEFDVQFDPSLIYVWTLDIEVESGDGFPSPILADRPINAVCIRDSVTRKKVVLTTLDARDFQGVEVLRFETERELLVALVQTWRRAAPDAVTGWNTSGFDLPYICNRIKRVLSESAMRSLSVFDVVRVNEYTDDYGNAAVEVDIYGVADLDYRKLYKKFTYKARESYSLNHIAEVELGEKKLDYSEAGSLQNLWRTNPQKFVEYNARDVDLVVKLDDKLRLLDLVFYLSYASKVNFTDVFSPIKTWDALVYSYLLSKKVAPPVKSPGDKSGAYEGAYVKDPQVGLHLDVVSFDVASLYPSIIRQWNMCPSTLVEEHSLPYGRYVKEMLDADPRFKDHAVANGVCVTANGAAFTNSRRGVFPVLVEKLYEDRKKAKKIAQEHKKAAELAKSRGDDVEYERQKSLSAGENTRQGAIKVLLNSLYGATGSRFFRYYDIRIAEGITLTGQVAIEWAERAVNGYLADRLKLGKKDRCLAIDTDSLYFTLEDLTNFAFKGVRPSTERLVDFLDKCCVKIEQDSIIPAFKELQAYCNCSTLAVEMKREAIADRAFWVAKKKYALDVHDNEGVRFAEPELKAVGLQLVQSSTPKIYRDLLSDGLKVLLRGRDENRMIEFVDSAKKRSSEADLESIAPTSSVNNLQKWEGSPSGTPMNVKAALVYNQVLRAKGLDNRYPLIKSGDKIKILKLRQPNLFKSHVIAFGERIPRELQLEGVVDRDAIFESAFFNPLKSMCDAVGVHVQPTNDIEDFFS